MADKGTAALEAKVKSSLTLGKCPPDSPTLINTGWTALLSLTHSSPQHSCKPLTPAQTKRWKGSWWLRPQGCSQTVLALNPSSVSTCLCALPGIWPL